MIERPPWERYGAAVLAVALAVVLRLASDPWLGDGFPFLTLFLAVAFAAWYGGRGPSLVAVVLGGGAAVLWLLPGRRGLDLSGTELAGGLVGYSIVALLLAGLVESQRRARYRAEDRETELEREVAARVAVERSLADREELMRVTLASIGDGVLTTDEGGRVVFVNEAARQLTGWTPEEAAGRPLEEVFRALDEESREPVDNPALRAMRGGEVVGLANHTVLVARDGAERAIADSAAPIRDDAGAVRGAVLVFRDVTERRRALRAQEQALATLDQLVASAPLGITILDEGMRYRHINRQLAEMNGVSAEEHLGRTLREVVPDLAPQVEPIFRSVMETGETFTGEIEGETAKTPGARRVWRESWFPIPGPPERPTGVGVVVQEITAERRAAERLARKNDRLRLLSETAAMLLVADDPNAMLPRLFERVAPHLGLDLYFHFLLDESGTELQLASWAGVEEDQARAVERLAAGEALLAAAARGHDALLGASLSEAEDPATPHLRTLGVRARACLPLLAGERLHGTLTFGSRERGELAHDEVEFLATIGRYVAFAYERARLIRRLSEADRRKDEFLATLAHELRNPLSPIRNSLELLRRAGRDADLAERARETMERQIRQMVRLVDDLLDVGRITRDQLELQREEVELATVVEHALETARPECEQSGHELEVELPAEPVRLWADPTRLAQVLVNLLGNACKFTPAGGRIRLAAEAEADEVLLRVRDTGVGIPAEMLPRIFDLFTQVDRSLERSRGGLGIGLSLVRRLVELHGGTVTAHSDGPGRGSELVVRLPRAERPSPAAAASEPPARTDVARRVLVVDDNRDSAESLAMLLELAGHRSALAHDGLEAVARAREFGPDVVLLDIGLPGLNGYDACRAIRALPGGEKILLVAVTGWGQAEDRRRSAAAGFDGHLVKPVELEALDRWLATER